jgi:hypothetical protein
MPLDAEIKMARAATALKMTKQAAAGSQAMSMAEDEAIRALDEALGVKQQSPPRQ